MEVINKEWTMFTVYLTLKNGKKVKFVSSMKAPTEQKAVLLAINNKWESGVKKVTKVLITK